MINAYAVTEAGAPLEPYTFDPGPLEPTDVEIDVHSCGICHSDLSMAKNEWGISSFPLVPGHEAAGTIAAVGEAVTHLKVGQRVGLGWHKGYCLTCPSCLSGDHNLCKASEQTIVGNHGGFADKVRAQAHSVVPLPDGVSTDEAGPLFCGGITVFNPMIQFGLKPTQRVAVIGIGGLGHLALQFARAWGCEVTAFTSESKREEALQMGAHDTLNSRSSTDIESASGRFDLILSTVNVSLDWNALLGTLRPKGRLHLLGAVLEPLNIGVFPMLINQLSVSSSPVGSPSTIATMLEFCARHQIKPVIEKFKMAEVNAALEHLESGKARYRIVLEN
jgi:uncharacterized zinc-type alcohol dehydrogenase-like protein